jgi:YVTN family beta-propeller protein
MISLTKWITGGLSFWVCAAMLAGCDSGGPAVTNSVAALQSHGLGLTSQPTKSGNVTFAIAITPKRAAPASRLTPKYVSPSTQSLKILIDGANPVVVDLTPASPNCSPNPAIPGSFICRATLRVATGNHVFTVTAYDSTGGTGNALSTNSTGSVSVGPTGSTVSIVLEGIVQYVVLQLQITNPPVGKAAAIGLTAIVEDADHNLIIGSAAFANPVTLTTSDATNGPLSKTTLNSPADASGITVNYDGARVGPITYGARATGLAAANVAGAILSPGGAAAAHLYVVNSGSASVSVFDVNNLAVPTSIITGSGLVAPSGAAIDTGGKLYVANGNNVNNVVVLDTAYGNAVLPTITGGGLNGPQNMTIDASGKLYVSNTGGNSVSIFDTAHGNAPLPVIANGAPGVPDGLAIDPSGKLYVALENSGSVLVVDTAHDNALVTTITGGGLDSPAGEVLDPSGRLYVANGTEAGSISIFDTATGDTALPPIPIGGTQVDEQYGAALDASGKLYVSDFNNNVVRVFDTAHGDVELAPITTGINRPAGLAIH